MFLAYIYLKAAGAAIKQKVNNMSDFHKKWIKIWQEAREEYRASAKRHSSNPDLRRCYVELALKQRSNIRELISSL